MRGTGGRYRVGVDIGGTFTDFALLDRAGGRLAVHKQLTTPADPSQAVLSGLAALLADNQVEIAAVEAVAHGTTLVTNALIERRLAPTGMLVTENFLDIPDLAREQRYDLFDLRLSFPEPLVPRTHRRAVKERIAYDGNVTRELDLDAARAAIADLRDSAGIASLAVCLLHSYTRPDHEQAIRAMARQSFPDLYVTLSSEVDPGMGEWERWTTTCMNACTRPLFDRYLDRLETGLRDLGFRGGLFMMTSSGGLLAPAAARRLPIRMLESGPAAGALMSAVHGKALGLTDLLSFDMGGTTAKGALVRGDAPLRTSRMEVARVHHFKQGSGLPARIPAIDMIEIGAGGGSIAALDERGLPQVGPRSAGADPGPACYGLGGGRPTLTDANLALGYLDPAFFLGGAMRLDRPAAERAIAESVARPLRLDLARAAWGIHEIANEDVARAFRIHASERGFDYRNATMVAFGGSGPLHALAIAGKLKIPQVVFPIAAGVMSAMGLLASPPAFALSRTRRTFVEDIDAAGFARILRPLFEEARGFLAGTGTGAADIAVSCRLDMRYFGQGHEIEVDPGDIDPGDPAPETLFAALPGRFAARYAALFGVSPLDEPLEIINWKVEARGPAPPFGPGYRLAGTGMPAGGAGAAEAAVKSTRRAFFGEGTARETPVYDRYRLAPGTAIAGPALIEERESTVVIPPGHRAHVDSAHNLIATAGD